MYETILSFSDFWALVGGMLITIALPRLAQLRTGAEKGFLWTFFLFGSPILTFVFGTLFLIGIKPEITTRLLQAIMFLTVIISIVIISTKSPGDQKGKSRSFFKRTGGLTLIFLPFIIIDAIGLHLPVFLNDLSIAFFVIGICLISVLEMQNLFGAPAYMKKNEISNYFYDHYKISTRERDVVELVILGNSNNVIGEKLFISEKTVENHLTSILRKTGLKNRIELFRLIHSSKD